MKVGTTTRILLCADDPTHVADVRGLLEQGGHEVVSNALDGSEPEDLSAYQMVILHGSHSRQDSLHHCRRLRTNIGDRFLPILYLTNDTASDSLLASLQR